MANERLDDLASKCIRCGFCLESCPTYLLTGEETESPRGRIYLARSADAGKIDWNDVRPHIDRCVGCRACETACPSGVEYGRILELSRSWLEKRKPNLVKQTLLDSLSRPRSLAFKLRLSKLLPGKRIPWLLSSLLSGQNPEADKPRLQPKRAFPPLEESSLPQIRGQVYLLEGCAMRVLFPNAHEATRRLLRRIGFEVLPSKAGCCGALHAHSGFVEEGEALSRGVLKEMPGDLPIIVNSAGCGSHLKGTGVVRALDVIEFLYENGLLQFLQNQGRGQRDQAPLMVTYHDACHLAHGQGIRNAPRELLRALPGVELVELHESDLCCGSGGIYNLTQPKLARRMLDRKWANIEATGAEVVAMGNPGCQAWIQQASREHGASIRVVHTVELFEEVLSSQPNSLKSASIDKTV